MAIMPWATMKASTTTATSAAAPRRARCSAARGGLLAGLGLLAIPGLGPIVAAGWLAATAVGAGIGAAGGAATGSLVGALKNSGHTEEDANVYSEGVRRGGTLVSAKVQDGARRRGKRGARPQQVGGHRIARRGLPPVGLDPV